MADYSIKAKPKTRIDASPRELILWTESNVENNHINHNCKHNTRSRVAKLMKVPVKEAGWMVVRGNMGTLVEGR